MAFWTPLEEVHTDEYGTFQVIAEVEESGLLYQWRNYAKSVKIKELGGKYANYCEDGRIKFYRSPMIRERAYPKFVK